MALNQSIKSDAASTGCFPLHSFGFLFSSLRVGVGIASQLLLFECLLLKENPMPIVRAEIWRGKSPEIKKALAESLTNAVVDHIGCPPQAVTIIIDEIEKANWFTGAKDSNELFPGVS